MGLKRHFYTYMKIQDFHKTNSYELTNLWLTLSKLMQSQVISSVEADSCRSSLLKTYFTFWLFCHQTILLYDSKHVILLFYLWMTNAMLYYTVDVLWYLYDVTHPRMFPPYPGLGVWHNQCNIHIPSLFLLPSPISETFGSLLRFLSYTVPQSFSLPFKQ